MSILQKIVENTRDNLKVKKTNLSLEEIKSSLAELSLLKVILKVVFLIKMRQSLQK